MTRSIKSHKSKEKGIYYNQVLLKKNSTTSTVYIPEKFAKVGNVVKIKKGNSWNDGWMVKKVWQKVDESFLDGMRNAVMHQRDVSDI